MNGLFSWLIVIFILGFIEIITINLVTVWFIASALVSMVLSLLGVSFEIQFAVFVILGAVLLITTRKKLVQMIGKTKNNEKTNLDRVFDMEGIVTEEISKNNPGEVKVDGKRWTAIASKKIEVGKNVKIIKIDGVKLVVEEVE